MMSPFFARPGIAVLAACVSLLSSGCANISGLGGSAEYGCKAPLGVRCDSVSGNYYNAIQNNLPSQRQGRQTDAAGSTAASRPRSAAAATEAAPSLATSAPPALAASPLRSQARVLRLWFKPWEDADRDLYDQGFVYVQIDNGHWLIDHAQQRIRDAYAPIRPPRSAALPALPPAKPAEPRFGSGTPDNNSGQPIAPLKPLPGATELPADDNP